MLLRALRTLVDLYFSRMARRPLPEAPWLALYTIPTEILTERARDGDGDAAFILGDIAEDEDDFDRARDWYEKAIALGNTFALNNLGSLHYHGKGMPIDLAQARTWYERAVQHGSGEAMGNLAWMYREGRGLERDPDRSTELLKLAVKSGSGGRQTGNAMVMLAWAYAQGLGVRRSPLLDLYWQRRAAQAGDAGALRNLGLKYLNGQDVLRRLALSARLFREAALQDDAGSALLLGMAYELGGRGVKKSLPHALYWYRIADLNGATSADEHIDKLLAAHPELGDDADED